MPRTVTSITVFLASPTDVDHEREFVARTIQEWNDLNGRHRGVQFELLRYESSVSAGFGKDGQDVINTQIGEDYDLLIAIFWKRLGSATPRARSGTVEEYERAFERYKNGENVDIAFFFKDVPVDFRKEDISQLQAVQTFEKEVQAAGALSKTFRDDDSFRFDLNLLLDRKAREVSTPAPHHRHAEIEHRAVVQNKDASNGVGGNSQNREADSGLDEPVIFDVSENLATHSAAATEFVQEMGRRLEILTSVMDKTTSELQDITKVRSLSPSEGKAIVEPVARAMNSFSEFLETGVPTYSSDTSALLDDIRHLIAISYDFLSEGDNSEFLANISPFHQTISGMRAGIAGAQESAAGFLNSIKGLQRTTSSFNKARRRLVDNLENYIEKVDGTLVVVDQALIEIDELVATAKNGDGA